MSRKRAREDRRDRGGPGTPATATLDRDGVQYTVHSYHHDPAAPSYGLEAAQALGLDPSSMCKTLVVEVDGSLVVAVVPVTGRLDLKALANAVGGKRATMADPVVATRSSGYVVGGISPLGQRRALRTVVDESVTQLVTVYVSGGRRGFDIGLAPMDLCRLTEATCASITRG